MFKKIEVPTECEIFYIIRFFSMQRLSDKKRSIDSICEECDAARECLEDRFAYFIHTE